MICALNLLIIDPFQETPLYALPLLKRDPVVDLLRILREGRYEVGLTRGGIHLGEPGIGPSRPLVRGVA